MVRIRSASLRRLAAAIVLTAAAARPAFAADLVLYRIFLTDGATLISYGEFARVGGRVVFSMPIGSVSDGMPDLQLVSVAESAVDWPRTDGYAEAVRARRYAATRGEPDFTRLSADVARTLNEVAYTRDPKARLEIAMRARRMLADWPSRNHGYRASDVLELSGLLDEVVAELKASAGEPRMELVLSVDTTPPPPRALLPEPTFRETIEQAFTAARLTPESTERIALLEAILRALKPASSETWAAALHARASADLLLELKTEADYAGLAARTLSSAEARARAADVKGLEKLIREVLKADDRLGRRRPQATSALLATLDTHLANARQLRLARDAWAVRMKVLTSYRKGLESPMERFRESIDGLQEIKALAGPSSRTLARLADRMAKSLEQLARMRPSRDLRPTHDLLTSAFQMAGRAVAARQNAIRTTSMDTAWQASSAAAGALMLFERVNEELQRLALPPAL